MNFIRNIKNRNAFSEHKYKLFCTLLMSYLGLMGCGGGSSGGGGAESSTSTASKLKIRMVASGLPASSLMGMSVSDSQFLNSSIGSGTPESLSFKIKKISLKSSTNSSIEVPIFSDASGKEIVVRDSSVDLSGLFSTIECVDSSGNAVTVPSGQSCECGVDAGGDLISKVSTTLPDGSTGLACPELNAGEEAPLGVMSVSQTGSFDILSVEYVNLGKMKGCISGKFKANSGDGSGTAATYCTVSGKGLDSGVSTNANEYPGSGPGYMNVYLNKSGPSGGESINKEYRILGGVTLDGSSSPTITFVVDTGRMLRFYNGNTNFSTPGPSYSGYGSRAFFFTTVFEDSTFVFLGKPGSVRGYRWAISSSNPAPSATAPGDGLCASSCTTVAGWMTLILDGSNAPILSSFMPDDDNALTVLKGANVSSNGTPQSSMFVNSSGSLWTIQYRLGSDLIGEVKDFNLSTVLNGSFDGTFSSTNANGNAWGQLTWTRKL